MRLEDTHLIGKVVPMGSLTFAYHDEPECPGIVSAHCLELDIGGQGATPEAATKNLQDAIEAYLLHHLEADERVAARPAPAELWNLPKKETYQLLLCFVRGKAKEQHREVRFVLTPSGRFDPEALQAFA